jgi:hypothetical protein
MEKCENSASESLCTSKKTLGTVGDSSMDLRVNGVSAASSLRCVWAGVEKAVAPSVWMSMMWTVLVGRT